VLELLRVERGEDVAELIMRRRAIRERPEPAQKREFPRPEAGDIDEALGPRQNRQQADQQHLIERVDHLAPLPRVRQRPEMIKKNNRFIQSTRRVHHATPLPNQRRPMDSELYPIVTHSFTRLPCSDD
jgi:hypothetical protein